MTRGKPIESITLHFLDKLIIHPSGHWGLSTKRDSEGYSVVSIGNGKKERGHRIAHRLYIGPIPESWDVDHLCRLRWCVCPFHLEAVPHSVNIRRVHRECKRGHDLTDPANYYQRKNGGRLCRPCNDLRNARRYVT